MRLTSFVALSAIVVGLSAASPAYADFINFSQFGPTGTTVASGGNGVTQNGVSFTIPTSARPASRNIARIRLGHARIPTPGPASFIKTRLFCLITAP
jgi:hypothetical protein